MLANPGQHGLAVRSEDGVLGALRLVEEAVGAHHLAPSVHGRGGAGGGRLVEAAEHLTDTLIEAAVAQVDPV